MGTTGVNHLGIFLEGKWSPGPLCQVPWRVKLSSAFISNQSRIRHIPRRLSPLSPGDQASGRSWCKQADPTGFFCKLKNMLPRAVSPSLHAWIQGPFSGSTSSSLPPRPMPEVEGPRLTREQAGDFRGRRLAGHFPRAILLGEFVLYSDHGMGTAKGRGAFPSEVTLSLFSCDWLCLHLSATISGTKCILGFVMKVLYGFGPCF